MDIQRKKILGARALAREPNNPTFYVVYLTCTACALGQTQLSVVKTMKYTDLFVLNEKTWYNFN